MKLFVNWTDNSNNETAFVLYKSTSSNMSSKTQFARVEYTNNSWAVSGSGSNLALVSKDVGAPSSTGDIFEISYDETGTGDLYYEVAVESVGGVLNSDPSSISGPINTSAPTAVGSVSVSSSPAAVSSVSVSSRPAAVSSVNVSSSPAAVSSVTASNSPAAVSSVTASNSPAAVSSVTPSLITTSNWTPASLTNNIFWIDANNSSSLTISGGEVTEVQDLSGNNFDVTPPSSTYNPTIASTTQNGKTLIQFDGTDHLANNSVTTPTSGNLQAFIVCEATSVSNLNDSILSMDASNNDWQLCAGDSSLFQGQIKGVGIGQSSTGVGNESPTGMHIWNASFDFGSSEYLLRIDGEQLGGTSTKQYLTKMASTMHLRVFANRSSWDSPGGKVAEVIIYEDVTEGQRQKVEGYLAHKWGLESELSSTHPFKTSAPVVGGSAPSSVGSVSVSNSPSAPSSISATSPTTYPYQSFTWSTTSTGPNAEILSGSWVLDTSPPIGTWGYTNSSQSVYGTIMLDASGSAWGYYDMYGSGTSAAPYIKITNSAVITNLTLARSSMGDSITNVVT